MKIRHRSHHRRWGFFRKPNPRLVAGVVAFLGVSLFTIVLLALLAVDHHAPVSRYREQSSAGSPDGIPPYLVNMEQGLRGYTPQQFRDTLAPGEIQQIKSTMSDQQIQKFQSESAAGAR